MKREEFEALLSLVGSELSGTQWAAIQGARLIAEVLQTISESLEVLAEESMRRQYPPIPVGMDLGTGGLPE